MQIVKMVLLLSSLVMELLSKSLFRPATVNANRSTDFLNNALPSNLLIVKEENIVSAVLLLALLYAN
jgi:hypothetical protein